MANTALLRRSNGHRTHRNEATCPTCESPISKDRLAAILGKLRAHDAEIERAAEARSAVREAAIRKEATAAATAALTERITKAEQAKQAVEQQMKKVKADQEAAIKARLETEQDAAAKKLAEAVNGEKVKAFEEKTKLITQ